MASTCHSNWRGFKIEKTGQWPEMAEVHIKGKISETPGSCTFPYMCVCLVVQAPLPMGFPRQEYWGGCHFLLQGIFLNQGLNQVFLHLGWILYHWAIRETNRGLVTEKNKWDNVLFLRLSVQFMSDSLWSHGLFAIPWTAAHRASLSITNSQNLLKLRFNKSMTTSNHLIFCRRLLLLPSVFPSIRVFCSESVLHIRWPKYWSFCFSINPSNKHSGLISFKMDWLHLLAVQGTLKSLVQHHSSKASILWCSAFFIVQLSHPYMTTGKTIVLLRQTFVGKVMSLLFNMLSRLVITFLLRSKHLLISWLQWFWSPRK